LYPAVSALITLLHNVLHHPYDMNANDDLQRVEPLLGILGVLAESKKDGELNRMHLFCVELRRRARTAVDRLEAFVFEYRGRNPLTVPENPEGLV